MPSIDRKRPYIIIDPRAGHGAGIGGFKLDSQVGVALRGAIRSTSSPSRRMPEPGQTLADVTRAEAEFVREVRRAPSRERPSRSSSATARAAGRPHAAGGDQPRHHRPGRAQRRADGLLGRARRREPDALQWRADGRHLPALSLGPRRRRSTAPIWCRISSAQPARNFPKYYDLFRPSTRARRASSSSSAGGAASSDERGRDPLDRREPLRRQQAGARRGGSWSRGAPSTSRRSARRSSCSPPMATTSRRRSRR
jgi:hypothetical protein